MKAFSMKAVVIDLHTDGNTVDAKDKWQSVSTDDSSHSYLRVYLGHGSCRSISFWRGCLLLKIRRQMHQSCGQVHL